MLSILEIFVLFAINPVGFVMLSSLLIFSEYKIAKSIIKDIDMSQAKKVFSSMERYAPKFTSFASFQKKLNSIVALKKYIIIKDISSNIGMTIDYIKINNWFNQQKS